MNNKEYLKQYYQNNKEKLKQKSSDYYNKNKEEISLKIKIYKTKNKVKINKRNKKYREEHKAEIKIRDKKYRMYNWKELLKKKNKYQKEQYHTNVNFRLKVVLSSRLRKVLKTNPKTTSIKNIIGCSIEELKKHLESQFKVRMTWSNHGLWHIDHRKPCSSFDLSDLKQQKEAFHFSNLQPLWAEDNLLKSDKLNYV